MSDVGDRMQHAAEQRLVAIDDAWYRLEEDPDDTEAAETVGMWCGGCETCVVREVLDAALPVLFDAITTGEFVP